MLRIDINIKPSKIIIALFLVLFLIASIIIFCMHFPFYLIVLLEISLLGYTIFTFFSHGLLMHPHSLQRIQKFENDWLIWDRENVYTATLLGESTVTPWIAVLCFSIRNTTEKRTTVIFKNTLGDTLYYKLIVTARTAN